jgi:hypothetical protein
VDRVVFNAIVGEARRRWIVFDIVFAAFFSAKGAVATALWAVLPVRKAAVSTTGHRPAATAHASE